MLHSTPVDLANGMMQNSMTAHTNDPNAWAGIDGMAQQHVSSDDTWSNSSKGGPIVPTTLNVEDWFNFFGIHGDGAGLSNFA